MHENLYLRSQALESFSRLTDQSEALDWLNTSDGETQVCMHLNSSGHTQTHRHRHTDTDTHTHTQVRFRLFELSQGTLVPNLLHNRKAQILKSPLYSGFL